MLRLFCVGEPVADQPYELQSVHQDEETIARERAAMRAAMCAGLHDAGGITPEAAGEGAAAVHQQAHVQVRGSKRLGLRWRLLL